MYFSEKLSEFLLSISGYDCLDLSVIVYSVRGIGENMEMEICCITNFMVGQGMWVPHLRK